MGGIRGRLGGMGRACGWGWWGGGGKGTVGSNKAGLAGNRMGWHKVVGEAVCSECQRRTGPQMGRQINPPTYQVQR